VVFGYTFIRLCFCGLKNRRLTPLEEEMSSADLDSDDAVVTIEDIDAIDGFLDVCSSDDSDYDDLDAELSDIDCE